MMSFRITALQQALAGLLATGVPLIGLTPSGLVASGASDDIGIYAVVPWLAAVLRISVEQAAVLTFVTTGLVAVAVGLVGAFTLSRSPAFRAYAAVSFTAVTYLAVRTGDLYVFLAAVPIATVPWLIRIAERRGLPRWSLWALLAIGLAVGFGNFMRSHAGTPVSFLVLAVVLFHPEASRKRKAIGVVSFAVGIALVAASFTTMVAVRDHYLESHVRGYVPNTTGHPLWHSIYIGLGYVPNQFVPEYRDEVAMAKVAELAPNARYLSPEYETALRVEVFRIVRKDPALVLRLVAVKGLIVLKWLLLFGNIGFLLFVAARPPARIWTGLVAGLLFECLFGVLVVPYPAYLSGAMAYSALVAVCGTGLYLRQHATTARA